MTGVFLWGLKLSVSWLKPNLIFNCYCRTTNIDIVSGVQGLIANNAPVSWLDRFWYGPWVQP